jgi:glycosyltransferase 2 family protein
MRNPQWLNLRRWMLRILPAVVALGASIWWISGAGVLAVLRGCRIGPMVLGVALLAGAAMIAGLRWRAVLKSVRASPLPAPRAAMVLSLRAQAAVVLAPGGIGVDVLRGFEAGYGSAMLGSLTRVAILERLAGASVLTAIAVASSLLVLSPRWGGILAASLSVLFIIIFLIPGSFRLILGWTLVNQILALGGLAFGLAGTGVHAPTAALVSIAAVAAFAAMLPVSFNGYGVRELALAMLAPGLGLDAKGLAASGLVASTLLLAGLLIAALGARMIPTGSEKAGWA